MRAASSADVSGPACERPVEAQAVAEVHGVQVHRREHGAEQPLDERVGGVEDGLGSSRVVMADLLSERGATAT